VISALLGPVVIGILAGHTVHGGTGHLLGRFALAASFAFLAVSAVAVEPVAPHHPASGRRPRSAIDHDA
jgi:hypothetical protein